MTRTLALLLSFPLLAGCFGSTAPARSHFVLHGISASPAPGPPLDGLVRVRDLTAANIFEKSQIVIRKNPFELQYSEDNVWAVKPNSMVSDVIARALAESGRFTSVVRQLGELRPDYILSGDLHAIEVFDSGDIWFAHISLSLRLTRFRTGDTVHSFTFDERRQLPRRTFAQAARAISELLSLAIDQLIEDLERIEGPRAERKADGETQQPGTVDTPEEPAADSSPESEKSDGTIFVPEPRPTAE